MNNENYMNMIELHKLTVGERIQYFRKKKGYNQSEFARLSDIPLATLKKYEKSDILPKAEPLKKIADKLECSVYDLMNLECSSVEDVLAIISQPSVSKYFNSEVKKLQKVNDEENDFHSLLVNNKCEGEKMTIGEKIKMYREVNNMSQTELAHKINVPLRTIQKYEIDFENPKIEVLELIAEVFDISCNVFLTEMLCLKNGKDLIAIFDFLVNNGLITDEKGYRFNFSRCNNLDSELIENKISEREIKDSKKENIENIYDKVAENTIDEDEEKLLITASEVAEMLQVSRNKSYQIIHELNQDMLKENPNYIVIRGKVNRKYFEKRVYGIGK